MIKNIINFNGSSDTNKSIKLYSYNMDNTQYLYGGSIINKINTNNNHYIITY